ncbi:MAG: DNA pilot protein [Microviridae sp.]|nr:MAG: DNA pilot protein [Microviridae sp.]
MDPLTIGLISGGASLLGNIFSSNTSAANNAANVGLQRETNFMNQQEAERNRQFAAGEASTNRGFQAQMSNTAYQRAYQDMSSAGLNPAMMFGSGGASSTPSGGQASGSMAHFDAPKVNTQHPLSNLGESVGRVVNGAISAKTFDKMTDEIANLQSQEARNKAEENLTKQRTRTEDWETQKRGYEAISAQYKTSSDYVTAREADKVPRFLIDLLAPYDYGSKKSTSVTDQIGSLIGSAVGLKRGFGGPKRSTTQESGTNEKGQWYDRFREHNEWR